MAEPFSAPIEAEGRVGTGAGSALAALWADMRYALRQLRLNPGFSAPCIAVMAIGIGIGAAVFSISYDVALRPLPYPDPGALVAVHVLHGTQGAPNPFLTGPEVDGAAASPVFAGVAEFAPINAVAGGTGSPRRLTGLAVTGNLFSLLGTRALIGRTILPADARSGHRHVAVLSYACWRRVFGGRTSVVGSQVPLAAQRSNIYLPKAIRSVTFTIVGVMPPAAQFPWPGQVWIPMVRQHNANYTDMMGNSLRRHRDIEAIARLRDGASVSQAERSLRATTAALRRNLANGEAAWQLSATSLRDAVVGPAARQLLLWLLAALCVVLLTCLAVSNMLTARALARRQEVATRHALGAGRARLFRQFLVESVTLAAIASALGVALGAAVVSAARRFPPPGIPRHQAIGISLPTLLAVLAFAILTGLIFGLAPAWQFASHDISPHLRDSAVDRQGRPRLARLRSIFGAVQVSLAVVLAVGAVAASVGLADIMGANLGYSVDHLMLGSISLSHGSCSNLAACDQAIRSTTQRVSALPGVESAAVSTARPLDITLAMSGVRAQGTAPSPGRPIFTNIVMVTPAYFRTLGIRKIAGRTFTPADRADSPRVAVVNQLMAEKYFPGGSPVGRYFTFAAPGPVVWIRVVGEVASIRSWRPNAPPLPAFYVPMTQFPTLPPTFLLVRSAVPPANLRREVAGAVAAAAPGTPLFDVRTGRELLGRFAAPPRFRRLLLGGFGGLALLLAVLGVAGITAYGVKQRRREIGLRIALGAPRITVVSLVMRRAAGIALVGVAAGAAGAWAVGRVARSSGLAHWATSPSAVAYAAGAILCAVLAASLIPAARAARVDPAEALRSE